MKTIQNYTIKKTPKKHQEPTDRLVMGIQKDPEDPRDYIVNFNELAKADDIQKVSAHSLVDYAGEIENQLDTGSCVANAACSALEIMTTIQGTYYDLSRLFVYWNVREPYPELQGKDVGSYPRDAFKMINKYGVPLESDWKFLKKNINIKPPADIYEKALDKKAIEYRRVLDLNSVKALILEGKPVLIGMALGEQFYYLTGPLSEMNYTKVDSINNPLVGYHAVTIVGYDDNLNGGSLIFENSWSENWGDFGFFAMPYSDFFEDVLDMWVCTKFETGLLRQESEEEEPEIQEPDCFFNRDFEGLDPEDQKNILFLKKLINNRRRWRFRKKFWDWLCEKLNMCED